MSKHIPEPFVVQWQLLRERLTSKTASLAGICVLGLSVYAVWRILRGDTAPGRDAMAAFAAVGASLLIALSIERFHPRLGSDGARRLTAAGRTMPAALALLLGVFGIAAHPSEGAAKVIAAAAFLLMASGVLSVIYSTLDRAEARDVRQRDCDCDRGNT